MSLLRKAAAVVLLAAAAVFASATAASALDEPRVPENVGQYFATGLVPRLVDLFGAKAGAEVVFDSTTKVGAIHRVLSWTTGYLSGAKTAEPTQITNSWVAPITAADGSVAGVATVWINSASGQPELADFSSGDVLATALAMAPTGTLLIRDDRHSAWFATDGATLTPLVSGSSGVEAVTTPDAYQRLLTLASPVTAESEPYGALLIAVLVLGVVVVLLAAFVLLPDRRRRAAANTAPVGELPAGAVAGAGAAAGAAAVLSVPEAARDVTAAAPAKPTAVNRAPTKRPAAVKTAAEKGAPAKPAAVDRAPAKPANPKPALAKSAGARSVASKQPLEPEESS